MRFLLDANMPRSAADIIRGAGHECTHVRDTVLADAADEAIAAHAKAHGMTLVTRDRDFGDERTYPPGDFAGIIVLSLPETANAVMITKLVSSVLAESECLAGLSGRLAIAEFGRVRLRPRPDHSL